MKHMLIKNKPADPDGFQRSDKVQILRINEDQEMEILGYVCAWYDPKEKRLIVTTEADHDYVERFG